MSKGWRIIVGGEWFYGTKEQCERERAEFESTFTDEDFARHDPVVPEKIYSGDNSELEKLRASVAALEAENKRLKLVEEVWKLQKDLPEAILETLEEIETLQADLRSANADKDAYAQNAIDLRNRVERYELQRVEMVGLLRMAYLDENVTDERCARLEELINK